VVAAVDKHKPMVHMVCLLGENGHVAVQEKFEQLLSGETQEDRLELFRDLFSGTPEARGWKFSRWIPKNTPQLGSNKSTEVAATAKKPKDLSMNVDEKRQTHKRNTTQDKHSNPGHPDENQNQTLRPHRSLRMRWANKESARDQSIQQEERWSLAFQSASILSKCATCRKKPRERKHTIYSVKQQLTRPKDKAK
jgi:hypothetical protein